MELFRVWKGVKGTLQSLCFKCFVLQIKGNFGFETHVREYHVYCQCFYILGSSWVADLSIEKLLSLRVKALLVFKKFSF